MPAAERSAEEWIAGFAAALGQPPPTREELDALLRLSSLAAHASERRAAPVACWLAARAGVDPDAAHALAEGM